MSAHLRGSNLQRSCFKNVDLTGTDLLGADLTHADLPEGDAMIAMFERAKSLFGTKFDAPVAEILHEAMPAMFEMASDVKLERINGEA